MAVRFSVHTVCVNSIRRQSITLGDGTREPDRKAQPVQSQQNNAKNHSNERCCDALFF